MRPSTRTRPPCGKLSSEVFAVPGAQTARRLERQRQTLGVWQGRGQFAARQSLGTTSKPTAGMTATPACRAASFWLAASSMTSISPVMSRYDARAQTGGNHRAAPWPKTGLHSAARRMPDRCSAAESSSEKMRWGSRTVAANGSIAAAERPARIGLHACARAGFFGNQAARIPVGAVNHPLVGSHLGGPFTDVASIGPITK